MKKILYGLLAALAIVSPTSAQFEACLPAFCPPIGVVSACSAYTIPTAADLVAWIDACVPSSFTLSGGAVNSVVDQSSNAYVFVGSAVGPQYVVAGLNSRPTMLFQDSTTLQSVNYSNVALGTGNELTIFAAATLGTDLINGFHANGRLVSYTASAASHDYDNNGSFAFHRVGSTSSVAFTRNSVTDPSVNISYTTPRRLIFTLKSDGTRTLYVDGVPTSVAGAVANFVSPGYMSIGGSQFDTGFFGGNWSGMISEVGVYNVFKDAAAVTLLDTYLKNKWGM